MKNETKIFASSGEKNNEDYTEYSLEIVLTLTSILQNQLNLLNDKLLILVKAEENDCENITEAFIVIGNNIAKIKQTLSCLSTGIGVSINMIEKMIVEVSSHHRVVENILMNFRKN